VGVAARHFVPFERRVAYCIVARPRSGSNAFRHGEFAARDGSSESSSEKPSWSALPQSRVHSTTCEGERPPLHHSGSFTQNSVVRAEQIPQSPDHVR
jgi:hypothetical protein